MDSTYKGDFQLNTLGLKAETGEAKAYVFRAFGAGYKVELGEDFVANFKSQNSIDLVLITKKFLEFLLFLRDDSRTKQLHTA
jgi:hypothetical protein